MKSHRIEASVSQLQVSSFLKGLLGGALLTLNHYRLILSVDLHEQEQARNNESLPNAAKCQ